MLSTLKKLLLQLIPVAVGVYIGIIAGNWNEAKSKKEQQNVFIEYVIKELESNKKEIQRAYDYHSEIAEVMDSIMNDITKEQLDQSFFQNGGFMGIPKWTGIGIPPVDDSIYQSGIISNSINGIDFNTIASINKMYAFLNEYKDITKPMINRIINSTPQTTTHEVFMCIEFFTTDVRSIEKMIIKRIDGIVEKLDKSK